MFVVVNFLLVVSILASSVVSWLVVFTVLLEETEELAQLIFK